MGRPKELKTYWGNKGKFQKDYNRIEKLQLVPGSGPSACLEGELLRSVTSLYYDFYNNGCINNRSGNLLFLEKHAGILKLDYHADLAQIKPHSRGLRGNPNSDLELAKAYEKLVDKVIAYIVKQEKKALKVATKKKEKLNINHFTPNTEDSLDKNLPDYEDHLNHDRFFNDEFDDEDELFS